ncbi:MAG: DUF4837 family protein [Flavobacteriales bacterium]|nr:DUF4837 family protein [Flavobacteriales bacterium]MCB9167092.1 DUF4837 family protein [Flavobacteriales bacterium]
MSRALLGVLLFSGLTVGCDEHRSLPKCTGAPGEVLVVMTKGHWNSGPGGALRTTLGEWLPRLPQREHRFDLAQVPPEQFGSVLLTHRNLLIARIGVGDSSGVYVMRDVHSQGQIIVQINAPTVATWMESFNKKARTIMDRIDDAERDRLIELHEGSRDNALTASVQHALGFAIDVPMGYHVVRQDSNMAWLQQDQVMSGAGLEHDVVRGLLLYHFPYTSDSTFTVDYLVNERDSITHTYVEGPNAGSYMIVQRGFGGMDLMPLANGLSIDSRFTYRMRGLWGMHGAKMGGPFVQLSMVDTVHQRVICADGYIFSPQFDKREPMRDLEATCWSIRTINTPSP